MIELSDTWVAVLALTSSLVIGLLVARVIRVRRHARDNPVPHEVRKQSHAVANEATVVRATLQKITKARDPIAELIETMAGHRHDRNH